MKNDMITGSAGALKSLLKGLNEFGIKPETIERLTGIAMSQIGDQDSRVPLKNITQLNHRVRELSGVPSIGLELGTNPDVIYPSGIGWSVMANSERLLEGIYRFARYTRIISEFLRVEVQSGDHSTTVLFTVVPESYYTSFALEVILSRFVTTCRQILNKEIKPIESRFKHPRPAYSAKYAELFGQKLLFEQRECALVFTNDQVESRIKRRDAYLDNVLTRHAESLLSSLSSEKSIGSKVKNVIVNQLYHGQVDIETVAKSLNVSRSTLFRKLKEEGNQTFKRILMETRSELARDYLKNPTLTIAEIAYLLGFSDPSSFNRAFKSWEGVSPVQFRKHSSSFP